MERKSSLKRGGPLKRSRLRRRGRRAEREAEALQAFRKSVHARAGGRCERCGEKGPIHAHHMKRNPRIHDPEYGAGLCAWCHDAVHRRAVWDAASWFA